MANLPKTYRLIRHDCNTYSACLRLRLRLRARRNAHGAIDIESRLQNISSASTNTRAPDDDPYHGKQCDERTGQHHRRQPARRARRRGQGIVVIVVIVVVFILVAFS